MKKIAQCCVLIKDIDLKVDIKKKLKIIFFVNCKIKNQNKFLKRLFKKSLYILFSNINKIMSKFKISTHYKPTHSSLRNNFVDDNKKHSIQFLKKKNQQIVIFNNS